jgi:hypothetical protein
VLSNGCNFVGSTNTINICLIWSTIDIFISVSGCVGSGPIALLCPGEYNAVKTAPVLFITVLFWTETATICSPKHTKSWTIRSHTKIGSNTMCSVTVAISCYRITSSSSQIFPRVLVYLSYMMWLPMPTKCISNSILTMAPFAVIPHENEQLIINVGIRITISDSYDINQRLGLIKLA